MADLVWRSSIEACIRSRSVVHTAGGRLLAVSRQCGVSAFACGFRTSSNVAVRSAPYAICDMHARTNVHACWPFTHVLNSDIEISAWHRSELKLRE